MIGRADAASPRLCRRTAGEHGKPRASDELPDAAEVSRKERRTRRSHGGDLRRRAEIEHDVKHARQDVHMLVTVRVRRMDPRRLDTPQLRGELRTHLIKTHCAAQKAYGKRRMVVDKYARLRHERRDLSGRQDGLSVHERQMDADPERRAACGKLCRIVERCAARHERRRAQHAVRDPALDRAVDERVPPEIVRIYDN